jgi:serine/threonine-protein kinase
LPSADIETKMGSSSSERWTPGTVIDGRYRIVAALGRGGMGEVYRADDLKLGQAVALKFLPDRMAKDDRWLARFRSEVTIARRVSHPNVCRVHDIGDVAGHHFLTMEYIDGEDLASLLRRIGRLPEDKGIELSRQLCLGLAAAHDQGVLHRDLKPHNVMIDGRGQVRITDFGLAGLSEEISPQDSRSGTPAYMAPEQLAGKGVSVKSDLYALGLVLYEMFTGKPAFQGSGLGELLHQHERQTPTSPTTVVKGLDPALERAILRCLEKDPAKRPSSAMAVAASLPGGDPLAAAVAAGETPSPELVAAAGETRSWPVGRASALCIVMVLLLGAAAWLSDRVTVIGWVRPPLPPDVLENKAREIAQLFAGTEVADRAHGFVYNDALLDALRAQPSLVLRPDIARGRPPAIFFWFRQSSLLLAPEKRFASMVSVNDPPNTLTGMAAVLLDPHGRLVLFKAIPGQEKPAGHGDSTAETLEIVKLAQLEPAQLRPVDPPQWVPPVFADKRLEWQGNYPGTSIGIRAVAAFCQGKPVYFNIIEPWDMPVLAHPTARPLEGRDVEKLVWYILVLTAALLARRNVRLGRSDWKNALRLAAALFFLHVLAWVLQASHTLDVGRELDLFFPALADSASTALYYWLIYLALEPYIRRLWPETLISWTRLLSGRFNDRVVGQHLLVGVVAGLFWLILVQLPLALFHPSAPRAEMDSSTTALNALLGARYVVADLVVSLSWGIRCGLHLLLCLLLLRFLLRNQFVAGTAFVALWTTMLAWENLSFWNIVPIAVALASLVLLLTYDGLVASVVGLFTLSLLQRFPLTTDVSAWYFGSCLFALGAVAALGFYGFSTIVAGRRLFHDPILANE